MIPIFLLSLTVHEYAHAWAAKQGGDMTSAYLGRLSLNPLVHIDPIGTVVLPILLVMLGLPPFGWAKPVPVNTLKLRKSIWMVYVALAGPASNFILVFMTAMILKLAVFVGLTPDGPLRSEVLTPTTLFWLLGIYMIQVNIVLGLFNLIPIPPLDGSRVVFHFFIRPNPKAWPIWMALEGFAGILVVYLALSIPGVRLAFATIISAAVNGTLNLIH
jgi:Zn-dependent protease